MTGSGGADPIDALVSALREAIDADRLRDALTRRFGRAPASEPPPRREASAPPPRPASAPPTASASATATEMLAMFSMADLLDDDILGARPSDASFPLRAFFGALSERGATEVGYALGSAINFYFRVDMDEETKVRLGLEVSRLYYRFAAEAQMEEDMVTRLSPLLAKLMSTQLDRLRLESVDHVPVFDSSLHERSKRADATSARVRRPETFLCRVTGNDMVRFKAVVRT